MGSHSAAPSGFERETGPGGLEVRSLGADRIEAREAGAAGGPLIEGYGAVYEERTTIQGWFDEWDEEIAAGAGAKTIAEGDIRSMFNHDTNQLLGRTTAGTLRLSEDQGGLRYSVDINPDDPVAMGAHAKVMRRDVTGSSIWFRVLREEWTVATEDNGMERDLRRILEYQLFETGPVTFPAFETTTAAARAGLLATRSMSVLDSVLRVAGTGRDGQRARRAADLLANPGDVEDELRAMFARQPELRDALCSCSHESGRAADEAPGHRSTGTPPPGHLPTPAQYDLRARGLAARYGLTPIPGGSE